MTSDQAIELRIPGSAEYLRLARLVVADAGARVGFSFEGINDLRIAVDELCFALADGDADVRLGLTYRVGDDELVVEGECDRSGPGPTLSHLAEAILAAVVDEYELGAMDGTAEFRFTKALLPS